ncbi:MAG: DUF885 family protein [Proteobacteria bacterium]|nr:DUF885 family protein [Pseudomonadota bacterium]
MTASRTSLDRRRMLALGLATAIAARLPGRAAAADATAEGPAARRFAALLADFAEEILRLKPETATSLGLDRGARAALKSRLDGDSMADDARWARQVRSMVVRLRGIDREQLTPRDRLQYEAVHYAATAGIEGQKFYCGRGEAAFNNNGIAPFPVTQQDGAVTRVPEFLDSQHQIANAADAEAYLARVRAFARNLDEESERIGAQAARGIAPPSFIASNALGQLTRYRRTPVAEQKLVTSLVTRATALGIKGEWAARASSLVQKEVYPALDRQIAAFAKATEHATDTAGIDRLPDGEAFYRWALKLGTTTDMSPQEIHAVGLEQNRAIQSRMDAILRAQGMTQGSPGERALSLNSDPRQLFPDNDAGRAQLIDFCNERIAATRALMPRLSHLQLKAALRVKRVPPDIEDGAPLGYMNGASIDGVRPEIYYINLKSTTLWPKYQIPTLTAHEGIPGHAWQGAYLTEHSSEIPLIMQLMGFNAFIEGWALYAEQSVDEQGIYADDPFGQVGYLQAQQFRACRLVVDTGIHALKWTREQAIQFLVTETGRGRQAMTSEIDRYCVSPGQACGYKTGHNEILRQRERARSALGTRFDLAAFNDAVVKTGGVPLTVLGTAIDQYIAGA